MKISFFSNQSQNMVLFSKELLIILSLLPIDFVWADTIQLKNGDSVNGTILERSDQNIKIDVGVGVPITYFTDEILQVMDDQEEPKANTADPAAPGTTVKKESVPASPSEEQAPGLKEETGNKNVVPAELIPTENVEIFFNGDQRKTEMNPGSPLEEQTISPQDKPMKSDTVPSVEKTEPLKEVPAFTKGSEEPLLKESQERVQETSPVTIDQKTPEPVPPEPTAPVASDLKRTNELPGKASDAEKTSSGQGNQALPEQDSENKMDDQAEPAEIKGVQPPKAQDIEEIKPAIQPKPEIKMLEPPSDSTIQEPLSPDPKSSDANKTGNQGITLIQEGKMNEGLALMKKATELTPEDPGWHMNYGSMLYSQGSSLLKGGSLDESLPLIKEAEKELVLAAQLFEGQKGQNISAGQCYFLLGDIYYYVLEDKMKAKDFYVKSVTTNPGQQEAQDALKNF